MADAVNGVNQSSYKDTTVDNQKACFKKVAIGCIVAAVIFGVLAGVFMHKGNIRPLQNRTLCSMSLSALATISLISAIILGCKTPPDQALVGQREIDVEVELDDMASVSEDEGDSVSMNGDVDHLASQDGFSDQAKDPTSPGLKVRAFSERESSSLSPEEDARRKMIDKSGSEIAQLIRGANESGPFLEALTEEQVIKVVNADSGMAIIEKMPKSAGYVPDDKFRHLDFKKGKDFADWVMSAGRESQAPLINFFYNKLDATEQGNAVKQTQKNFRMNNWGNRKCEYKKRVEQAYNGRTAPIRPVLYTNALSKSR